MSANHKIYIKHNLTDNEIKNVDKIILERYASRYSEDYFKYLREDSEIFEKHKAEVESRLERVISLEEVKKKHNYQEMNCVHARVFPLSLTDEELYDDNINLYGFDFHNWIIESLNVGRFVELGIGNFNLLLSSSKTIIEVECFTDGLCLYHINKYFKKYQAMRKFVYGLVKVLDSSKDYKAIYINDSGIDQQVFNDIIEGFDYKSFQQIYSDSLKYDHIDAVNPPTEEEWEKLDRRDTYSNCPTVIDDFRDLKELESI